MASAVIATLSPFVVASPQAWPDNRLAIIMWYNNRNNVSQMMIKSIMFCRHLALFTLRALVAYSGYPTHILSVLIVGYVRQNIYKIPL